MELPEAAHVAVVDGTQFSLFRNSGTANAPKLKPAQMGEPGDAAAHDAGQGDRPRQNEEAGHAAAVAELLNKQVLAHKISALVVIADPRTLGEMRQHFHKQLEAVLVGDIAKTLTGQPADAIERAVAAA